MYYKIALCKMLHILVFKAFHYSLKDFCSSRQHNFLMPFKIIFWTHLSIYKKYCDQFRDWYRICIENFFDTDSNDKLSQEDNVVVVVGLNNDDDDLLQIQWKPWSYSLLDDKTFISETVLALCIYNTSQLLNVIGGFLNSAKWFGQFYFDFKLYNYYYCCCLHKQMILYCHH